MSPAVGRGQDWTRGLTGTGAGKGTRPTLDTVLLVMSSDKGAKLLSHIILWHYVEMDESYPKTPQSKLPQSHSSRS